MSNGFINWVTFCAVQSYPAVKIIISFMKNIIILLLNHIGVPITAVAKICTPNNILFNCKNDIKHDIFDKLKSLTYVKNQN